MNEKWNTECNKIDGSLRLFANLFQTSFRLAMFAALPFNPNLGEGVVILPPPPRPQLVFP